MLKKAILKGKGRKIVLIAIDTAIFSLINAIYYFIPLLVNIGVTYDTGLFVIHSAMLLASVVTCRILYSIYFRVWRYTSTVSYFKMVLSDATAVFAALTVSYICGLGLPFWHFAFVAPISLAATLMSRFSYRLLYKRKCRKNGDYKRIPVAILGAGQLGTLLAQELRYNSRSIYKPVMFIDIDRAKIGSMISGLKVYCEDEKIAEILAKYSVRDVFVAINNMDSDVAKEKFEKYFAMGCNIKLYDIGIKDIGNAQKGTIRDFQIEDLLFRKPVKVNDSEALSYYKGKTVLVTGGGGSIGSELCRQLAAVGVGKLIILDIYENNAYDIEQELLREYKGALELKVEIASVRDRRRLDDIFNCYRPDIVFHAAAHKHVPLMEHSPTEAIKNNVMGTYNTADMAEKYGAEKFILISTDKAVNPTNIMGASKRVCEMIVQSRADGKTAFSAVRFGNVLGSNGSVIPLFKRQIAEGGPVTITDKRIIRYFMTISEASQLVMQAGAMAKKGELFVLDMGKPVRIYDLALNMIRMSGLVPEKDIEIEEIGLRPGEKLYEELLIKTETLGRTENNMIFIEKDTPNSREEMEKKLELLRNALEKCDVENANQIIKDAVKSVVPTFVEPEEANRDAEKSGEMKQTAAV